MNETLVALAGAIASVEAPLKFWAFCAVVFLAIAIAFLRSQAFHKIWAGFLGGSLTQERRFRIARMVIGGLLGISILALILAFTAPLVLASMAAEQEEVQLNAALATYAVRIDGTESESVQRDFASAMEAFRAGDYTSARRRMLSLQRQVTSQQSQEALQGLITATFYARQEHMDGLRFICEQYKKLPKWDGRFRYQIHAHVRRISINEGYEDAEKAVASLRLTCHRADLSPVWAGIPLGAIEYLVGRYWMPDIDEADKTFLRYSITHFPRDSALDHALFFLGEYEELLRRFPTSVLLRPTLARMAEKSLQANDYSGAVRYAQQFLEQTPTPSRRNDALDTSKVIDTLGSAYMALGRFEDARLLVERQRKSPEDSVPVFVSRYAWEQARKIESTSDLPGVLSNIVSAGYPKASIGELLPEALPGTMSKLRDGAFAEALLEYNTAIPMLGKLNIPIPATWDFTQKAVQRVSEAVDRATVAELFNGGLMLRSQKHTTNIEYHVAESTALGLWKRCIYRAPDSEEAMKATYLRGAELRRMGRHRESANEFMQLIERHANGPLADDSLAELVSYNVDVLENDVEARRYLDQLMKDYPAGNAVDNGLYRMANFYLWREAYPDAVRYYTAVAVNYSDRRLSQVASRYVQAIQAVLDSAKTRVGVPGLRFYRDDDEEAQSSYSYVHSVASESEAAKVGLLAGDIVTRVDGIGVETVAQFYAALREKTTGATVTLQLKRGFDQKQLTARVSVENESYYSKSLRLDY